MNRLKSAALVLLAVVVTTSMVLIPNYRAAAQGSAALVERLAALVMSEQSGHTWRGLEAVVLVSGHHQEEWASGRPQLQIHRRCLMEVD